MSESLYTWGGTYFGKREGNSLFTYNGVEAGRFHGDEIFGADGAYLGELKNGKLITNQSRSSGTKGSFMPRQGGGHMPSMDHMGSMMLMGYEDFPDPDSFK